MSYSIKKVGSGKIGFIDYTIHDVKGDGHCFYRSVYQILKESPFGQDALSIQDTYINPDMTEDHGVEIMRSYIAEGIRRGLFEDAKLTIDNLCSLTEGLSDTDKEELFDQLEEMYPFVTIDTCNLKGVSRYYAIANMIENMEKPVMYASSLEIDIIKGELATKGDNKPNLTILIISNSGRRSRKVEEKWKSDLLALLENAVTRNVAVLLNKNNVHYQYLTFKGPTDDSFHAIINRRKLADILSSQSYTSALETGMQSLTLENKPSVTVKDVSTSKSKVKTAKTKDVQSVQGGSYKKTKVQKLKDSMYSVV